VIPPSRTWSGKQSRNEKKVQGPDSLEMNFPCPTETCQGRKPSVVKVLAHQFDVDESTLNNESYPNMKIDSFNAKIQEVQVQDDSKDLKSNFADVESLSGPNDELYRNQSLAFVDTYDADIKKIREAHQEKKNKVKPALDENYAEMDDVLDLLAPSMIEEGQNHGDVLGILKDFERDQTYQVRDQDTIGRDPTCAVVLTGREVSRRHCKISSSNDKVYVLCTSKTNPIRINGVEVPREKTHALANLDEISVGKESLTWFKVKYRITEEATKKEKIDSSILNIECSAATLKKENIAENVSLRLDTTVADVGGAKPFKLGELEREDSDSSDVLVEMSQLV